MTKREAVAEFARANSITEEAVHNRIRRGSLAFANGELVKCVSSTNTNTNTNTTNTNTNTTNTNTNTNTTNTNNVSIANTAVPSIEEEAEEELEAVLDAEAIEERKKLLDKFSMDLFMCKVDAIVEMTEDYLDPYDPCELNDIAIAAVDIMLERGLLSQNDIEQIHREAPEIIRLNNIDNSNKGG